ncbi:unnamed protein product [Cuscuta europaea]|uniref:Uncharacterized protein n=1 Tax=Cuscuta europaea TaxID=41803 RepID=A0A9P1ECS5_CUSEU|nr:unnamed protein product [Cuscuta europaea]
MSMLHPHQYDVVLLIKKTRTNGLLEIGASFLPIAASFDIGYLHFSINFLTSRFHQVPSDRVPPFEVHSKEGKVRIRTKKNVLQIEKMTRSKGKTVARQCLILHLVTQ